MGCGCIKVRFGTDEQKKKTISLAHKLAQAEKQTYVIYEQENEEFTDAFAAWERDGRPGTIQAVIEP